MLAELKHPSVRAKQRPMSVILIHPVPPPHSRRPQTDVVTFPQPSSEAMLRHPPLRRLPGALTYGHLDRAHSSHLKCTNTVRFACETDVSRTTRTRVKRIKMRLNGTCVRVPPPFRRPHRHARTEVAQQGTWPWSDDSNLRRALTSIQWGAIFLYISSHRDCARRAHRSS